MTKDAITSSVFDRLGLSKASSSKAVETTFEIIKKALEGDEDLLISGFGQFWVRAKAGAGAETPRQASTSCWQKGGL